MAQQPLDALIEICEDVVALNENLIDEDRTEKFQEHIAELNELKRALIIEKRIADSQAGEDEQ